MDQNEQAAREAEHHPDPIDGASAETAIHVQDAIEAQRQAARAIRSRPQAKAWIAQAIERK